MQKRFKDKDLKGIFDEDPWQTEMQLVTALNVTEQCISQRMCQIWMVQKRNLVATLFDWQGDWTTKDHVGNVA